MTSAPGTTLYLLESHDLQALARVAGPCVTIRVPGFRPGESAGTRAALLRQLAQKSAQDLGKFSRSPEAAQTAMALDRLMQSIDGEHGGPGLTLFCAPAVEQAFLTPHVVEQTTVGSHFQLIPVVRAAMVPHEIAILGLSQKHVRIWRATPAGTSEVPLPAGVPVSLAAAGAFDRPDHTLENRSAATSASKRGVRFGTSSDHDDANEYKHKFMLLIAQGMHKVHAGLPIFLIGVREDLLEFRRAAKDASIFEAEWHTNPEHCSLAEVETHAHAAANHEYYRRGEAAAGLLPKAKGEILQEPSAVINAARQGRVHRLFVAEQGTAPNGMPPESGVQESEDLLNLAAVETLRMGGEVWTFPGTSLAAIGVPSSGIAAILRF